MKISIITLFPQMFEGPFNHSIIKNAQKNGKVKIEIIDLRKFGLGRHKTVDDRVYGGGVGMVLRVDVLKKAIDSVKNSNIKGQKIILMGAGGKRFDQKMAYKYSKLNHIVIVCGHYEGVDHRVLKFVSVEVSVGDFVLTGGEIPTMLIVDSVVRLLPGVLKEEATKSESFSPQNNLLLEYPQYTRPREFQGLIVPKILLSGNHAKISEWRKREAERLTKKNRPELFRK